MNSRTVDNLSPKKWKSCLPQYYHPFFRHLLLVNTNTPYITIFRLVKSNISFWAVSQAFFHFATLVGAEENQCCIGWRGGILDDDRIIVTIVYKMEWWILCKIWIAHAPNLDELPQCQSYHRLTYFYLFHVTKIIMDYRFFPNSNNLCLLCPDRNTKF